MTNNNISTIITNVTSTKWSNELTNNTISNLVHHTIEWKNILLTIPALTIKYYIGVSITITSVLLLLYVLLSIEQTYTNQKQLNWIESNIIDIDSDNNDSNNNNDLTLVDDNNDKEQNQNEPSKVQNFDSISKPSKSATQVISYRKLLPSQRIIIVIQVIVLTLFNYLLLVYIPFNNNISILIQFIGMILVWIVTLKNIILTELGLSYDETTNTIYYIRPNRSSNGMSSTTTRRIDRLLMLISLFLLLAGGLSYTTYCTTALLEGEIYTGLARIVGYDTRSYNNTIHTTGDNTSTIRTNLKVSWGGNWGCPHSSSSSSVNNNNYCTADVNGAVCQTQSISTKKKKTTVNKKVQNTTAADTTTADTTTMIDDSIGDNNNNNNNEDVYYDVYWETQIDSITDTGIVLYKDKDEEVDINYTDDYFTHDKEEVTIKYTNTNETVDITKGTSSSIINATITTNSTTSSTTNNNSNITIVHDEEEDFTANGTVTKKVLNETIVSSTKNNNNTGTRTRQRRLTISSSSGTGTNGNSSVTNMTLQNNPTTTISKQVQKDVNESITEENTKITTEENNYKTTIQNEATVSEQIDNTYYTTLSKNTTDTIKKLQNENSIFIKSNEQLKQKIIDLQNKINTTEQKDDTLINNQIILSNTIQEQLVAEQDKELENGSTPKGYATNEYNDDTYNTVFNDDYWNSNEWDTIWGEYSCDELFDQAGANNEYGTYDPTTPPGYTNSTYNDKWPTIQIYGNCHTCTAYLIDYYTTQHYHQAVLYNTWAHIYFKCSFCIAIVSIVCYCYTKIQHRTNSILLNATTNGASSSIEFELRQSDLLSSRSHSVHGTIGSKKNYKNSSNTTTTTDIGVLA